MFELDSVVLILILIYLIVRRFRENSEPAHNTIVNNSSKLLSLPDELFIEIMSLLNQLDKINLLFVNKRMNNLARVSLQRVIYVNNGVKNLDKKRIQYFVLPKTYHNYRDAIQKITKFRQDT